MLVENTDITRMVETRIFVLRCLGQMEPTGGRINAYRLLNDNSEDREKRRDIILRLFLCILLTDVVSNSYSIEWKAAW